MKNITRTLFSAKVGIPVICLLLLFGGCGTYNWGVGEYNTMAVKQEDPPAQQSIYQSKCKMRADMVPNLVAATKGGSNHEINALVNTIAERAKATKTTIDVSNMTPEQFVKFDKMQGEISQAMGKLMVLQEAYPDLKANVLFQDFITEYTSIEREVNGAREEFIKVAKAWNKYIKPFPRNVIAKQFDFVKVPYFEASAVDMEAPKVDFGG